MAAEKPEYAEVVAEFNRHLDQAVLLSTKFNVTPLPGTTIVFCDVSDSMKMPCSSARGLGKPRTVLEVALLLALMCKRAAERCHVRCVVL